MFNCIGMLFGTPGFLELFMLLFFVLGIALSVFWLWMLVDCAMNEPSEGNDKVIWILIIIFLGWLGALIYFFARRPRRMAEYGK